MDEKSQMANVRDTTRMFSRTQMVTTTSTTSTTPLVEGQDVVVKAKDGTMLIDSPKYGQKLEQSGFKIVNSDDSDKEMVNKNTRKNRSRQWNNSYSFYTFLEMTSPRNCTYL